EMARVLRAPDPAKGGVPAGAARLRSAGRVEARAGRVPASGRGLPRRSRPAYRPRRRRAPGRCRAATLAVAPGAPIPRASRRTSIERHFHVASLLIARADGTTPPHGPTKGEIPMAQVSLYQQVLDYANRANPYPIY